MAKKIVLNDIHLIAYDFDGVMTDNRAVKISDGAEAVFVNRSDGLAIAFLKDRKIPQVIITSERNPVVIARARKLFIPALCNISDKKTCLKEYCKKHGYDLRKTLYVGNDINDLEVMKVVGYPVCPSDACVRIKDISRIVLDTAGGAGVIRNLLEYIC